MIRNPMSCSLLMQCAKIIHDLPRSFGLCFRHCPTLCFTVIECVSTLSMCVCAWMVWCGVHNIMHEYKAFLGDFILMDRAVITIIVREWSVKCYNFICTFVSNTHKESSFHTPSLSLLFIFSKERWKCSCFQRTKWAMCRLLCWKTEIYNGTCVCLCVCVYDCIN